MYKYIYMRIYIYICIFAYQYQTKQIPRVLFSILAAAFNICLHILYMFVRMHSCKYIYKYVRVRVCGCVCASEKKGKRERKSGKERKSFV